jgi:hypothetical protein
MLYLRTVKERYIDNRRRQQRTLQLHIYWESNPIRSLTEPECAPYPFNTQGLLTIGCQWNSVVNHWQQATMSHVLIYRAHNIALQVLLGKLNGILKRGAF